jgi:replicative DNA helicase
VTSDPLAFDFGLGFEKSSTRLDGERSERRRLGARALPYHHAFLDDYLRCIMPNDLILLGAETGAGKTELARHIGAANARNGKRVYYFALEAEDKEIERRTKYAELAGLLSSSGIRIPADSTTSTGTEARWKDSLGMRSMRTLTRSSARSTAPSSRTTEAVASTTPSSAVSCWQSKTRPI